MDTKVLDRNERALDRLYRSLQANHGRSCGRQIHECYVRTTLESAIEDLISWMAEERGFSVNYQINIRQSLERFVHWIRENGDKSVTAIRIEDLTSFLAYEKRRGLASGSLRQITISLQMLFRVLKNSGDIKNDPAKTLEAPKVRSRLPQVLKKDEIRQLLSVDLQRRPFPLRDRAMMELFYSSGIRLSELTGATLENLSLPERIIKVCGKGNKTRIVPVTRAACGAIGKYLVTERPALTGKSCASEIFLSRRGRSISNQMVWVILKEIARLAGIKRTIWPHLLRHTMATDLLKGGADLRVIQELLGHENLSTTEIYTHLDVEYLGKVLKKHHPRGNHDRRTTIPRP